MKKCKSLKCCPICESSESTEEWQPPIMVFSDGKLAKRHVLELCRDCGCYFKVVDSEWQNQVSRNYSNEYVSSNYAGLPRETHLGRIKEVCTHINTECDKEHLKILDYGMGRGDFCKYFLKKHDGHCVYGYDLYPQSLEIDLLNNESFIELDHVNFREDEIKFDYIVLLQTFEHIIEPQKLISSLLQRLEKKGSLIIQIPSPYFNPIDLVVYDHIVHFSPFSGQSLAKWHMRHNSKLFDIETQKSNGKELLFKLTLSEKGNSVDLEKAIVLSDLYESPHKALEEFIKRIEKTIERFENVYIFGTTYSSKWVYYFLNKKFKMYNSVDLKRLNKVNENSLAIMPSPREQAKRIAADNSISKYICL